MMHRWLRANLFANGLNLETMDIREGRDALTVLALTGRAVSLNAFLGKEDPNDPSDGPSNSKQGMFDHSSAGLKSVDSGGQRHFGAKHAEDFQALSKFQPGLINVVEE